MPPYLRGGGNLPHSGEIIPHPGGGGRNMDHHKKIVGQEDKKKCCNVAKKVSFSNAEISIELEINFISGIASKKVQNINWEEKKHF